jgi:hypothetical protein
MMREGGTGMVYFPLLNYANGNLDFLEGALDSDDCVNSLSDGAPIAGLSATRGDNLHVAALGSGPGRQRVCHWSMRSSGSAMIPRAVWA